MKRMFRVPVFGMLMVGWAVLPGESLAELYIESSEQLTYLVEGMEASLDRIETIEAHVTSTQLYEVAGEARVDIINSTHWISRGARHKFETQLTQLYDGELPPEPVPGQRHVPVGQRFTECAYASDLFVEFRPASRTAIIRTWKNSPASTLQDRAAHEPHFYGTTIKGLSLADIVLAGKYWHRLPEGIDPAAQRRVRWTGTREHKGRQVEAIEMSVKWIGTDGARNDQRYDILVEPNRGFTVPFISIAYARNDGPLEVFETVETECVNYEGKIWVAKQTGVVESFADGGKPGKSRTTIIVDDIEFDIPVTDDQLKVNLTDGTRLRDEIGDAFYRYAIGAETAILNSIEESLRQEGLDTAIPIGAKAISESESEPGPAEEPRASESPGGTQDRNADLRDTGEGGPLALWVGSGLGAVALAGWIVYRLRVKKRDRVS